MAAEHDRTTLLDLISVAHRDSRSWNPISQEKLDTAGRYVRPGDGQRVLDIGCGAGSMLCDWVVRWGIHGVGVDVNPDFLDRARQQAAQRGVSDRLRFEQADVRTLQIEPGSYDVVTCVGAADALGGFGRCADWAASTVRAGGTIAIGDSLSGAPDEPVRAAAALGLDLIGLVVSGVEDWDEYYSAQWAAAHRWAAENPEHPDRTWLLDRMRSHQEHYLHTERGTLNWALFVFAKH